MRRLALAAELTVVAVACRGGPAPPATASAPAEEPPVAVNAEPAVQYPPDLYDRRVEGDVVLRLFVDSSGRVSPESTRVVESSGFAPLDSAAVRGVPRLRYAPGRRRGLATGMAFLQTVQFRHPAGGQRPPPAAPAAAPPPVRVDTPRVRRDTVRRDTVRPAPRVAPDSAAARRDSGARKPDSTPPAPAPDTTRARPDTNATAS